MDFTIELLLGSSVWFTRQLVWEAYHTRLHKKQAEANRIRDEATQGEIRKIQEQVGYLALGLTSDIRFDKEAQMNFRNILDAIGKKELKKGALMEIFRQGDDRWADKELGVSGLKMRNFGCVVTNIAQMLVKAGHDTDPGRLVDELNSRGGFTDNNHPSGSGLIIWAKVGEIFPVFHFGEHAEGRLNVNFVKGVMGRYVHWITRSEDQVIDPLFGVEQAPANFVEIAGGRIASIDRYVAPEPEPTPEPEPAPEFPRQVIVTADIGVYVRTEPNTQSSKVNYFTHQPDNNYPALPKGATFIAVELVEGESVDGNNKWYKSQFGNFVWSGACN